MYYVHVLQNVLNIIVSVHVLCTCTSKCIEYYCKCTCIAMDVFNPFPNDKF